MVINNVTKFHKILKKNIRVRERTSFKMVNFHQQRAITIESLVLYGPLSNLKKTLWYLTMIPSCYKILIKIYELEGGCRWGRTYLRKAGTYGRTGVTLNARPLSWRVHNNNNDNNNNNRVKSKCKRKIFVYMLLEASFALV